MGAFGTPNAATSADGALFSRRLEDAMTLLRRHMKLDGRRERLNMQPLLARGNQAVSRLSARPTHTTLGLGAAYGVHYNPQ
ncbi:hypothetical protein NDU88_006312 [Pleurodeles waltl]|uniref:Uncharacterized protein n=1 Tax=Pleurodeles waltl TaxID=8319 RepID=A0AAV7NSQ2_PLEWA|nr:hypothetical protein NDU88_006312 [Pleurodeles waltl]